MTRQNQIKTVELKSSNELIQHDLLNMYFVQNMKKQQIAREMNLPVQSVKHIIARALFELRKASNDPEYLKAKQILYGN